MASQLVSGSIVAPGFNGLNSQESGITLDSGWALTAANCVIDKYGRIGARKGWELVTTDKGTLTTGKPIKTIFEYKDIDGNISYLCSGDNKLFITTDILHLTEKKVRDATNTGDATYTISNNNWSFCSLPYGSGVNATGNVFLSQLGHPMLVYNQYSGTYIFRKLSDVGSIPTGLSSSEFDPSVITSGYGRVWAANLTTNKTTLFYSTLLDGTDFNGAGSGILDISSVVGNNDYITSIATHNHYLIVFCTNNIVIYTGADDVDNLQLYDVVRGVGCLHHNTVQNIGTDVIFMSATGLRALGRTIQEKSMPMRELSLNIRDDLVSWINGEDLDEVRSIFYERDAFYLLTLPTLSQIVCFDCRSVLPNGAARVTIWDSLTHTAFCSTDDNQLLLGQVNGIAKYNGYSDNGTSYLLRYHTNYFDMGSPTQLKMLKRVGVTIIGGQGQSLVIKYGFDYSANFRSYPMTLGGSQSISEYNIGEYNIAEYSGGIIVQKISANVGGNGKVIQLGFEATINGDLISIQKVDVAAISGKVVI